MKFENALELDWDSLLKRRSWLDYLPGSRVAGTIALILALMIWGALSLWPVLSWFGSGSLPMSTARFTQTKAQRDFDLYSFHHVQTSFGTVDLKRVREFQKGQFENLILSSTPDFLRGGLRDYLPMALDMAQKYSVDPFWVLAVMWTESHFNPQATSRVDAQGLMQIMPTTGHYLVKKMSRFEETEFETDKLLGVLPNDLPLKEPKINIEMGAYYLKNLLHQFSGSHRLATVAYNMGPNGVRRRLRRNLPTGVQNLYLDKVRRAYKRLTRDYLRYLAKNEPPYAKTLVLAPALKEIAKPAKKPLASFSFKLPPVPQVKKISFVGKLSFNQAR
jgi:hypothetical protein